MRTFLYDIRRTDGQETRVIIDEISANSLYEQLAADLNLASDGKSVNRWKLSEEIPENVVVRGEHTQVLFKRKDGQMYFFDDAGGVWTLSTSFYLDEQHAPAGEFVRY